MPNEFGGELTYSLFETKQGQTITAALCKKSFVLGLTLLVKVYLLYSYRLMKLKQFWPIQSKFLTSFSESHVSFQNKFTHLNFKFCLLHASKLLWYAILGEMSRSVIEWYGDIIADLLLKSIVDQQDCSCCQSTSCFFLMQMWPR